MSETLTTLPSSIEIPHLEIAEIRNFGLVERTAEAGGIAIARYARYLPTAAYSYATGKTMEPVLAYAEEEIRKLNIDFSNTWAFHQDERWPIKTATDASAFAHFIYNRVIVPFGIRPDHTFFWNGLAADPNAEANRYNSLLAQHPTDLSILSIGTDGHMAFILPGTPFGHECHYVPKLSDGILHRDRDEREEEIPDGAITQGPVNILRARNILLIAYGTQKGLALHNALYGKISTEYPASALRFVGHKVHIYVDEMAAAALQGPRV